MKQYKHIILIAGVSMQSTKMIWTKPKKLFIIPLEVNTEAIENPSLNKTNISSTFFNNLPNGHCLRAWCIGGSSTCRYRPKSLGSNLYHKTLLYAMYCIVDQLT